ncbi:glycosyl hydrolase family 18 protein [Neobacillus sp. D3-1R]|uniref:glycosyl hydrolase family 18 protein n=1 Tax=Neobacillus sp. D3-1R TaxID=3445778 RepID=UPI003FA11F34
MNKKRGILLTIIIIFTFTGGFFSGVLYTNKHESKPYITVKQAQKSIKNPIQKEKPKLEKPNDRVLIGYIQDYRDPNMVDYSKLTHIIFSFAHPSKNGDILLNGELAIKNLRTMVAKAHKHDTKVMLAVGGWFHISGGESYSYFKAAISKPVSRTKLVNELVSISDREKLDGIDIDFEHPRSSTDAKNLMIFTKELSQKLHSRNKELSIAVNAKVHSVAGTEINNVVYNPTMFQYVNHVNIMAYDGQWDGGYNAANLSPYPYTENIVNYWTKLFDRNKLSKEKLVLGVPFYAQPVNPAINQVSYSAIIKNNPANAHKDTVKMNGTTYYYNGDTTVQKKTKLALDHGFGGMMMWEAGHDAKGQYSLTSVIYDVLNNRNLFASKENMNSKK